MYIDVLQFIRLLFSLAACFKVNPEETNIYHWKYRDYPIVDLSYQVDHRGSDEDVMEPLLGNISQAGLDRLRKNYYSQFCVLFSIST